MSLVGFPTERNPVKLVTLTSLVLEETKPAAIFSGWPWGSGDSDSKGGVFGSHLWWCDSASLEMGWGQPSLLLPWSWPVESTPSSGSISSARGLASPARPSQCSLTGANVSGFESSPFWRWLAPNPWQILSKISDAACLFYPGSLCGCAGHE